MMKRFLLITLLLAMGIGVNAQQRQLFDGGMMVHTGYLSGEINPLHYTSRGAPFGIGGVLRFHIGDHLRVGGEGYVSTLSLMDNGSYVRMGWGGVVVDGYCRMGRWAAYAELCAGGGSVSTLLVFAGVDGDWAAESNAVLHNGSFVFINPALGVEYALTDHVRLTFKGDRLTPLAGEDVPTGMRFYLGFIFAH